MKTFFKTLTVSLLLVAAVAVSPLVHAQVLPQKLSTTEELTAEGKATLTVEFTYDASGWKQWKALIGDDPARMKAAMKYQFAAYVLDDFKLDTEPMNRTAKVTMTSAAGPELRRDGTFRVPIEAEFSKVSGSGREWFFSGNNAAAGGTLMTLHIILPPTATNVELQGSGGSEQGLVYSVPTAGGKSGLFTILGGIIAAIGALGLVGAFVLGKGGKAAPHAPAAA